MLALLTTTLFAFASAQDDPAPYCAAGPTSVQDSNIGEVTLEGIDDAVNCPGVTGVQVNLNEKASLTIGKEYTLTYHVTTCGGPYNRASGAWIDFNANQVFDDDELLGGGIQHTTTNPDEVQTVTFTVPSTATPVAGTRLRVMVQESSAQTLDSCAVFAYGGVKDFAIDLTAGGLSGGWIFIFALGGGAFLYLAGGAAFQYNNGQRGSDLIINKDFWSNFGSYVSTGFSVTFVAIQGCIAKVKGGGTAENVDYEDY
jgi:hypothetical protein